MSGSSMCLGLTVRVWTGLGTTSGPRVPPEGGRPLRVVGRHHVSINEGWTVSDVSSKMGVVYTICVGVRSSLYDVHLG